MWLGEKANSNFNDFFQSFETFKMVLILLNLRFYVGVVIGHIFRLFFVFRQKRTHGERNANVATYVVFKPKTTSLVKYDIR